MVQYNKNLINNKKLNKFHIITNKKNVNNSTKLVGGNIFTNLPFIWKVIILLILLKLIMLFTDTFFKLKINGLVFPFIFGYLGYQLYNTLTVHMKEIGLSLTDENSKNSASITSIITNLVSIIQSLPLLIPKMPKIPNPTFNYQPFKGLREGIQYLRVPISIEGEEFRLSINFPKLEIPFMDPLAGICCVWEQMQKLLGYVEKAIEPPKKIVDKIFGAIRRACLYVKDVLIMRNIKRITQVVGIATYPPIGMFTIVLKFLEFIDSLGGDVSTPINNINNIIDKLNSFRTGDFIGGNNYATINSKNNINNYQEDTLGDILYKIHLLDYEEKVNKKSDSIMTKLSIYQIYKIQNSKKQGLIRFINKHKTKQFKKFLKQKFIKYKKNGKKFNYEKKYQTQETNEMVETMKKTIENIKNSTYDGYNLDEIKKKYNTVISNSSNIDKYTNWRAHIGKHGTQYGGGIFSDMIDALNIVKIIRNAIRKIPKTANIVCYIVQFVLDKIKIITDIIGAIQNLIFSKIPVFMQKIKDLIVYVNDIAKWFTNAVIKKGIGIIEAAIDLVTKIGQALPGGIGEHIFMPIKIIFKIIIAFLKLPFAEFFFAIVDILTNIPKFFNKIADAIMTICRAIQAAMQAVLDAILEPALAIYRAAKAAWEAFKRALTSWGGAPSMYSSNLEKIFIKNKKELSMLIYTYEKLPPDKINDYYMKNLEKLIYNKNKKIQNIYKLITKYDKKKKNKKLKKKLKLPLLISS